MKLNEIISKLEKVYPCSNKEEWDNVGLLLGKRTSEIKKIQISLDVTMKVIENAVENNVDLIISHHPLIFSPIKEINDGSILGNKILKLIENKIAVYSMHTNLDSTIFGLNDFVGKILGFVDGKVMDPVKQNLYKVELSLKDLEKAKKILDKENLEEYNEVSFLEKKISIVDKKEIVDGIIGKLRAKSIIKDCIIYKLENKYLKNGIGRIYSLKDRKKLVEVIDDLKEKLKIKTLIVSGYAIEDKVIKKIALVNGSGSSYWKKAKRLGADVLITGDLKYHDALDAKEEGMYIIDIGHYESEHFFNILIEEVLKEINDIELLVFNDEPVLKKL